MSSAAAWRLENVDMKHTFMAEIRNVLTNEYGIYMKTLSAKIFRVCVTPSENVLEVAFKKN